MDSLEHTLFLTRINASSASALNRCGLVVYLITGIIKTHKRNPERQKQKKKVICPWQDLDANKLLSHNKGLHA